MFIDDILLKHHDNKICRIVSRLNSGTQSLLDSIQTDLDSKIAPAKTQLFASSDKVRRQVQRRLQARAGGDNCKSGANLGCETAAGAPPG